MRVFRISKRYSPQKFIPTASVFVVLFLIFCLFNIASSASYKSQRDILDGHGTPDSFTLMFSSDDVSDRAKTIRVESWNYFALGKRFDFLDGICIRQTRVKDVPELTLLPKMYRPGQFRKGMRLEDVREKILGDRPYETIDMPADILPEGDLVVAEQILLGFVNDRLVYVETVPVPLVLERETKP